MGDSLHVLFNAPADQPDHASLAVRCAVELQAFSRELSERRAGEMYKLGNTRIGVNSGDCVVGNFGGAARFDYTAHGDAINTAARLEGANKYLGTRTCVSGATQVRCGDLHFRPVGQLQLKGKRHALRVFEPVSEEFAASNYFARYIEAYDALSVDERRSLGLFTALQEDFPSDGLVRFHYDRLSQGGRGSLIVLSGK